MIRNIKENPRAVCTHLEDVPWTAIDGALKPARAMLAFCEVTSAV